MVQPCRVAIFTGAIPGVGRVQPLNLEASPMLQKTRSQLDKNKDDLSEVASPDQRCQVFRQSVSPPLARSLLAESNLLHALRCPHIPEFNAKPLTLNASQPSDAQMPKLDMQHVLSRAVSVESCAWEGLRHTLLPSTVDSPFHRRIFKRLRPLSRLRFSSYRCCTRNVLQAPEPSGSHSA